MGNELVASHIPVLVRAFTLSKGDVLELGTGYFSTLVLRWLSELSGRKVYSYESRDHWFNRATKNYGGRPNHEIILTKNYDDAKIERPWGMAFVDHGPNDRRIIEIERLKDWADFIVIHDTNEDADKSYHYSKIWPLFKYRVDVNHFWPPTSVVSNKVDVTKFQW